MAERNETYRGLSQNWEAAAARMDELRVQELRALDVAWAMRALDDAYEAARRHAAPRLTSGLVAQQALFMKARRTTALLHAAAPEEPASTQANIT